MIVLTSPHSLCPGDFIRRCDLRAAESLDAVARAALDAGLSDTVVLPGTVLREESDLNRAVSRDSPWWDELRRTLDLKPSMLLDIHSFPRLSGSSHTYGYPSRIAVIYLEGYPPSVRLARAMARTLDELPGFHGLVRLLAGTHENAIMVEAAGRGVPSCILEFCEDRRVMSSRALATAARAVILTAVASHKQTREPWRR